MATYNVGDYVKAKFHNDATGIGEWMWLRVSRCDEQKQVVFGTLDSEPSMITTPGCVGNKTGRQRLPDSRAQKADRVPEE